MFVSLSASKLFSFSLQLLSRFSTVGVNYSGAVMAAVNNCRLHEYQGGIKRFPVPADKISWKVEWPDYAPVDYTAPVVLSMPVWADPDFRSAADGYLYLE